MLNKWVLIYLISMQAYKYSPAWTKIIIGIYRNTNLKWHLCSLLKSQLVWSLCYVIVMLWNPHYADVPENDLLPQAGNSNSQIYSHYTQKVLHTANKYLWKEHTILPSRIVLATNPLPCLSSWVQFLISSKLQMFYSI